MWVWKIYDKYFRSDNMTNISVHGWEAGVRARTEAISNAPKTKLRQILTYKDMNTFSNQKFLLNTKRSEIIITAASKRLTNLSFSIIQDLKERVFIAG